MSISTWHLSNTRSDFLLIYFVPEPLNQSFQFIYTILDLISELPLNVELDTFNRIKIRAIKRMLNISNLCFYPYLSYKASFSHIIAWISILHKAIATMF